MTRYTTISLIITAIAANTVPRWIAGIDGNKFCKYQAASFLLLSIAAMGMKGKIMTILWQWTILLAINNLYDEVFGDPFHCGKLEISFAVSVTLLTIIRIALCKKTQL